MPLGSLYPVPESRSGQCPHIPLRSEPAFLKKTSHWINDHFTNCITQIYFKYKTQGIAINPLIIVFYSCYFIISFFVSSFKLINLTTSLLPLNSFRLFLLSLFLQLRLKLQPPLIIDRLVDAVYQLVVFLRGC